MIRKAYLGDAVYAAVDQWGRLVLTTEDGGDRPTNTIVFEPDVLTALFQYVHSARAAAAAHNALQPPAPEGPRP